MRPNIHTYPGSVILSVNTQRRRGRAVLVITASAVMARAVSDFLNQLDGNLRPVWLTSVEKACERLEWDHPKMVILDTADTDAEEAVGAIHHISPETELLFLGGTSAQP